MNYFKVFALFIIFLVSHLAYAKQLYSNDFFKVVSNLTTTIKYYDTDNLLTEELNNFLLKADRVNRKYEKKVYALFSITRILAMKVDQIMNERDIPLKTHLKQLNDGLQFALKKSPSDYYKHSFRYIIKLSKENYEKLLQKIQKKAPDVEEEYSSDLLYKRATRWPHLEKFLKSLSIIFMIAAALMDTCGNVPQVVCQITLITVLVGLAFWITDLARTILATPDVEISEWLFL